MILNKSVKLRLAVSLGICIALLLIVGALGIYSSSKTQQGLERTYKENVLPLQALGEIREAHLSTRVKVTAEQRDRNPVTAAETKGEVAENDRIIDEAWAKYFPDMITTDAERTIAEALHRDILVLRASIEQLNDVMIAGDFERAREIATTDLRAEYPKVLNGLKEIVKANVAQADSSYNANTMEYAVSRNIIISVIVLAFILATALSLWLIRGIMVPLSKAREFAEALARGQLDTPIDITSKDEFGDMLYSLKAMETKLSEVVRSVRRNAEEVDFASGEIAQGNDDLNRRTQEQAASLEETAASMEEITTTVRQNADNAVQADHLVQGVSRQAQQGGEVVQQAVGAMTEISTSSRKISSIVGLIDEIAFQTNLLALNAAVEAARAGEQGRGFAVVASEVRNLASRSANAAKEIKGLVEDSVAKVESGTALVDRAGQTLTEIVDSVKRVTDLVGEIAVASKEQAQGIDQVNVAVSQMDAVTQQNASLVEQSSAASRSLQSQATALLKEISFFQSADAVPTSPVALMGNLVSKTSSASMGTQHNAAPARMASKASSASKTQKIAQSTPPVSAKPTPRIPAKAAVAASDDDWTEF
ncbi:methyl-accepting chemotaxis protein [Phytohalomonas tamaricis]|uniref:methyl-accepting chemotaxis protein n=1 Tax=Phytohalomonas tamaricis TaxID=2081032 RepID=UPI000D0B8A19|nr:methyl-accepting chemotaxis protein [Phytohalomonas tamaricis]